MCAETLIKVQGFHRNLGDENKAAFLNKHQDDLGRRFLTLAFDLWKNPSTVDHYAAMNTSVLELKEVQVVTEERVMVTKPKWVCTPLLLEFNQFPDNSHTGSNIYKWALGTLNEFGFGWENVLNIVPDGASPNLLCLKLIKEKDDEVEEQVCDTHQVARAVLRSLGVGGKSHDNDDMKALVKKNSRVGAKIRCSTDMSNKVQEAQEKYGVTQSQQFNRKGATRWNGYYMEAQKLNLLASLVNDHLTDLETDSEVYEATNEDGDDLSDCELEVNDLTSDKFQYSPAELILNRQLEATLKPAYIATQRLQGDNEIAADQCWDNVYGLYSYYSSRVKVPRPIKWPLEETITFDLVPAADLKDGIKLQREIMAHELKVRFIDKGPTRCQLMAIKLNPTKKDRTDYRSLTDPQVLEMEQIYIAEFEAMVSHMDISDDTHQDAARAAPEPEFFQEDDDFSFDSFVQDAIPPGPQAPSTTIGERARLAELKIDAAKCGVMEVSFQSTKGN